MVILRCGARKRDEGLSSLLHLEHSLVFNVRIVLSKIEPLPVIANFPVRTLIRELLSERLRMQAERMVYAGKSAIRGFAVIRLVLLWQRWYRRDVRWHGGRASARCTENIQSGCGSCESAVIGARGRWTEIADTGESLRRETRGDDTVGVRARVDRTVRSR